MQELIESNSRAATNITTLCAYLESILADLLDPFFVNLPRKNIPAERENADWLDAAFVLRASREGGLGLLHSCLDIAVDNLHPVRPGEKKECLTDLLRIVALSLELFTSLLDSFRGNTRRRSGSAPLSLAECTVCVPAGNVIAASRQTYVQRSHICRRSEITIASLRSACLSAHPVAWIYPATAPRLYLQQPVLVHR